MLNALSHLFFYGNPSRFPWSSHIIQQARDQGGPTGLMAGAEAPSGVAVEVLMEKKQVAPMRVGGEKRLRAMTRPATFQVGHKK